MQNIVIEFESNTKGIDTAAQAMEQLAGVEKTLKSQFDKTTQALKERDAVYGTLSGGLSDFVSKLKNADKAAVGMFGTKGIKEFRQGLLDNTSLVKLLTVSIGAAGEKLKTLGKGTPEYEKLNAEIEQAVALFKELSGITEEVEGRTQSFKSRLKELKNELQLLEDTGQENTDQFRQMSIEAAKLEDQIGDTNARIKAMSSDTFAFDALTSGIQGVASAFQVGQGAVQLFGDDNEQLQEALVKLNAVMAITQGLTQVRQTLERQSAVMIGVTNAQQKISLVQTELQVAAESESVVVRYAAIGAQKALNLVMSANPAGLLLTAIAGLAGILLYFSSKTDEATDKQKRFNEELKNELDLLEGITKEGARPYEDRVKALQNELTALKDKNVSQGVILQKEKQLLVAQQALATFNQGSYSVEISQLGEISAQIENQTEKVKQLKTELANKENEGVLTKWLTVGGKSKDEITEQLKVAQDGLSNLQRQQQLGETARDEAAKTTAEVEAKNAAIIKFNREQAIKDAVAGSEAVVLNQIEGTHRALAAELHAIEVRKNADLLNVNLTQGERAKIIAQARQAEAKAQFEFDQKQSEIASKSVDAKAGLQNEGTQKRLALELQSLDIQQAKELQQFTVVNGQQVRIKELSLKQIQEIEDRYQKLRIDKTNATNQKIAEDEINSRINNINSQISALQLSGAQADNEQLLQLKKDLVTEQGFLEVTSVTFTEKNEQLRASKIAAVNAKILEDKKQLERDRASAEINSSLANQNAYEQLQANRAQRTIDSAKSTFSQREKAVNDFYNHSLSILDNELAAEEAHYKSHELTYEEYQTKLLAIQDRKEALSFQHTQTIESKRLDLQQQALKAGISILQQLSDAEFEIDSASRQSKLDKDLNDLNARRDKELSNKSLTEQQKAEIDKRYKAQESQLKRKAWLADQDAQVKQAEINGLLAVTNALATVKPFVPAALIAAGLAFATATIQVGRIRAIQPPAFKHGKIGIDGPGTETSDSIHALLSKNESVINAAATRKYRPALEAINSFKFEEYLAKFAPSSFEMPQMASPLFNFPTMTTLPKWAEDQMRGSKATIDYNLLAERIATAIVQKQGHITDTPGFEVNIDKTGIHAIAKEGNDRTEFLNDKFKYKS